MDDRSEIARAAAEAAARRSYGKLVAYLAARTRDVAGAEDALAEAFAAALERWPRDGVPERPEAWLLAVARRRDVDAVRRRLTGEAARDHLRLIAEEAEARMTNEELPDERLRLMFACAHPAIEPGVRAPLMLQAVLGFDAATIARLSAAIDPSVPSGLDLYPLAEPGEADLTVHVDFERMGQAGLRTGAALHGPATQRDFLLALGLAQRAQILSRSADAAQRKAIFEAFDRLIEPGEAGMGDLFKVMALSHPALPPLPGFDLHRVPEQV